MLQALEGFRRLVGLAGFGIARMEMEDGRARFRRRDCFACDLIGRDRQIGRHGRRMDGAGHRASYDRLAFKYSQFPISFAARFLWAANAINLLSRHIWRSCRRSAGMRLRRSGSILSITGPAQSTRRCICGNRFS